MFEPSLFFLIISFILFTFSLGFSSLGFSYQKMTTIKMPSLLEKKISQSKKYNLCVLYGLGIGKPTTSEKSCSACKGKGGVNCKPCNGKGIDKVNGSVLERWTCKKCKGFGFVPCTSCNAGSKGLTPEQTGER